MERKPYVPPALLSLSADPDVAIARLADFIRATKDLDAARFALEALGQARKRGIVVLDPSVDPAAE
jgi:hypothetical protein